MQFIKKEYNYYIGVVKAICAFLVVCCHVYFKREGVVGIIIPYMSGYAVPIFWAITFAFSYEMLLNQNLELLQKRIKKYLIPWWFWSITIFAFDNVILFLVGQERYSIDVLVNTLIFGGGDYAGRPPFYFLFNCISVTIILFIVGVKKTKYMGLIFGFCYVLQYSGLYYLMFKDTSYIIRDAVGEFISAAPIAIGSVWITYAHNAIKNKKSLWLMASGFSVGGGVLIRIICPIDVWLYSGIDCMLIACGVLEILRLIPNVTNVYFQNIMRRLSRYTLAVFCLHGVVGNCVDTLLYKIGKEIYRNTLLDCVFIYIICYMIGYILDKTKVKIFKFVI